VADPSRVAGDQQQLFGHDLRCADYAEYEDREILRPFDASTRAALQSTGGVSPDFSSFSKNTIADIGSTHAR
jgi:hypothetical protein